MYDMCSKYFKILGLNFGRYITEAADALAEGKFKLNDISAVVGMFIFSCQINTFFAFLPFFCPFTVYFLRVHVFCMNFEIKHAK